MTEKEWVLKNCKFAQNMPTPPIDTPMGLPNPEPAQAESYDWDAHAAKFNEWLKNFGEPFDAAATSQRFGNLEDYEEEELDSSNLKQEMLPPEFQGDHGWSFPATILYAGEHEPYSAGGLEEPPSGGTSASIVAVVTQYGKNIEPYLTPQYIQSMEERLAEHFEESVNSRNEDDDRADDYYDDPRLDYIG